MFKHGGTAGSPTRCVPAQMTRTCGSFTGLKIQALRGDVHPAPHHKPPGHRSSCFPTPPHPGAPMAVSQPGLPALSHPRGRGRGPIQPPHHCLGGLGHAGLPRVPPRRRTMTSPTSCSSARRSPRGLPRAVFPKPGWTHARVFANAARHLSAPGTAAWCLRPCSSPAPSRSLGQLQSHQRPLKCSINKHSLPGGCCCRAARAKPGHGAATRLSRPPGPSPPPRSYWEEPLSRLLIWETEAQRGLCVLGVRCVCLAAPEASGCRQAGRTSLLPQEGGDPGDPPRHLQPRSAAQGSGGAGWAPPPSPPRLAFPPLPVQLTTQTHALLWGTANDWPN